MATTEATEATTAENTHAEAVQRALAARGLATIDEYRASLAASRAAEAETATDAAAAHWRRLGAARLAVDDNGQVRRGQWIEATADVLATTRRRCHGVAARLNMSFAAAEDMAADVLAAEAEAAAEAGRQGCVRAERLTAAYLGLTGLDWKTGAEARRLSALTVDGQAAAELLAAEDITPLEDEAAEDEAPDTSAEAHRAMHRAVTLARRLDMLPVGLARLADLPTVCALAAASSDLTAADLAAEAGMSLAVWKREAAAGGRLMAEVWPDAAEAARRLVPDHNLTWRATPLEARRLGADLPDTGRHYNVGQLCRQADVLMARPPLPGRQATASRASDGQWRAPAAADHWQVTRPGAEAEVFPRCAVADRPTAAARNYGQTADGQYRRPHRAAPGLAATGLGLAPMPPARGETLAMAETTGAHGRYSWRDSNGTWHLGQCHAAPDYLARRRPLTAEAPRLTTWRPGQARRAPQTAAQWTTDTRLTASLAAVAADEAEAEAPRLYRPAASYNERNRWQTWRLALAPAWRRRGMLAPASLDMVTAAELEAEAARPFSMVADLAAAAAEVA